MFNICENTEEGFTEESLQDIEDDIRLSINDLLKNRLKRFYAAELFNHAGNAVEIVYPRLNYAGPRSLVIRPNKLRYSLSLHRDKSELALLRRVLIRPSYVEANGVELAALYLWEHKTLALYLVQPDVNLCEPSNIRQQINQSTAVNRYLSVIAETAADKAGDTRRIEKFFRRQRPINHLAAKQLRDVSEFYSINGY